MCHHPRPHLPSRLYLGNHLQAADNRVITDLAIMDVVPEGLKIVELAPGVTREFVQSKTGVQLI